MHDAVSFQGSSYLAVKAGKGITPASSTADWAVLAAKGSTGQPGQRGPQGVQGPAGPQCPDAPLLLPSQTTLGVGVPQVLSGTIYRFNSPNAVAFDGTHLWVTNQGGNSVTEINASDGSLARVPRWRWCWPAGWR